MDKDKLEMFEPGLGGGLEDAGGLGVAQAETEPKKRPFHIWTVAGKDHKLKLTTRMIEALERKYRSNILNLITADGIPPLSTMLTVIQAAATPWEHGMSYEKVQGIYDRWCDEGGNQMDLLSQVIMPTMVVSGFFTERQGASITAGLKDTEGIL